MIPKTQEELSKYYPKKPKYFGFKHWLSRYVSMWIIILFCYAIILPLVINWHVINQPALKNQSLELLYIFGYLGIFMSLMFTALGHSFRLIDKLFKIHYTKQRIRVWDKWYDEYKKYQEFLELKEKYDKEKNPDIFYP
jgi:hypothetical protein